MSQDNKEAIINTPEQAAKPKAEAKPAAQKNAPKQKVQIVLTGAASYSNLNFSNLGVFKKGAAAEIDSDAANELLKTGLFKKI